MAMCVIAVVVVAPCQCFSLGANQTTSPGRISSMCPPSRCAQPKPDVTINVCPSGCVCHAVRAPGSNVTLAPRTRAGSGASTKVLIRTFPVNQSARPFVDVCESDRLISMSKLQLNLSITPVDRECGSHLNSSTSQLLTFSCLSPDRTPTVVTGRRTPRRSRVRARFRNRSAAAPSAEPERTRSRSS
jgi:hypothetical protein